MQANKRFDVVKRDYKGRLEYRAKDKAYAFNLFDDYWQLGLKEKLSMGWMNEIAYSDEDFINVRVLLAEVSGTLAPGTVNNYKDGLRRLGADLTVNSLKLIWPGLSYSDKNNSLKALSFAVKRSSIAGFNNLYEFVARNSPGQLPADIFNPTTGCYSEVELLSINEQFRLMTDQIKVDVNKEFKAKSFIRTFMKFRGLIAAHLMKATRRRPVQLAMLKWIDILPIGVRFSSHHLANQESMPQKDDLFSDVDKLQIRTFVGKKAGFRGCAERQPHVIESDLSELLMLYRQKYEALFSHNLIRQGIVLSPIELSEIMFRCPVVPEKSLFYEEFLDKKKLFSALGLTSRSYHLTGQAVGRTYRDLQINNMNFRSDRIDDEKLLFSNNRHRHTVLTNGAIQGLPDELLAAMTGVTANAVKPYKDLSFEARLSIDEAFATNDVINKFGRITTAELKGLNGFIVKNEFDEEVGIQKNPNNCNSCLSKLSAPLGCYPCSNFVPNVSADHKFYLEKAQNKYEANKNVEANETYIKKFADIILYIRITIQICDERKLAKRGVRND